MFFIGTKIFKKPCESSIEDGGAGYIDKDGNTVKIKDKFLEHEFAEEITEESRDEIPTAKAVYDFVMSIVVDAISVDSTDDEIPTAKAVYDFVTSVE